MPTGGHPMLRFTRWRAFISCFLLSFCYGLLRSNGNSNQELAQIQEEELYLADLHNSSINEYSLTAILPVTQHSLPDLPAILTPFFHSAVPKTLRQILLVSPDSLAPQVRSSLFNIISTIDSASNAECVVRLWPSTLTQEEGFLRAATTASTEWLLLLDERGLQDLDLQTRRLLLDPPSTSLPLGPRGILSLPYNSSCVYSSSIPQRATYLVPPFVISSNLLRHAARGARSWRDLGDGISRSQKGTLTAVVLPSTTDSRRTWCPSSGSSKNVEFIEPVATNWGPSDQLIGNISKSESVPLDSPPVNFVILFSSLEDIRHFALVACRIQERGHPLRIILHQAGQTSSYRKVQVLSHFHCRLSYTFLPAHKSPDAWLHEADVKPDIIITLKEMPGLYESCLSATVVRIPREDLLYSDWMSSLMSSEWRDWNVPRITLNIITNDRPKSLTRLLSSTSSGRFYGDQVDVRINFEQSSDFVTLETVRNWRWNHGSLFLHRRIVHGGLLPAVVESWYPHTDDTYGVLLEDDVELSPFFYAWIKMVILRYRYGNNKGKYPQMFGISLYQAKNTELHPSGRQPFDAEKIFRSNDIHSFTPYLSQVPCSWGAVYFPEHWREFHDYLSLRFSERAFPLDETIVPNVRSNQWTESWKKYFIELVYLRGYVMLYPNFPDFVSLSTNHLEVGSHVKIRSKEKRDAFAVPLMGISSVGISETPSTRSVGLLDLPSGSLPQWDSLPTLNLTGALESLDVLREQGIVRRSEMAGCKEHVPSLPFDAYSLLCLE